MGIDVLMLLSPLEWIVYDVSLLKNFVFHFRSGFDRSFLAFVEFLMQFLLFIELQIGMTILYKTLCSLSSLYIKCLC